MKGDDIIGYSSWNPLPVFKSGCRHGRNTHKNKCLHFFTNCVMIEKTERKRRRNFLPSILKKLEILSDAAKYDVSCSSSGSKRGGQAGKLGSALPAGCCHTWTEDGRCVSLLKVLMSNACCYNCIYCIHRSSNDVPRATSSPRELEDLPMAF